MRSDTEVYLQTEIFQHCIWLRLVLFFLCFYKVGLIIFYSVVLAVNICIFNNVVCIFLRSGYCGSCEMFLFFFYFNIYRMNTYQCCKILMLFIVWILSNNTSNTLMNVQCSSFVWLCNVIIYDIWLCNIITTRVVIIRVCGKLDKVWPDF